MWEQDSAAYSRWTTADNHPEDLFPFEGAFLSTEVMGKLFVCMLVTYLESEGRNPRHGHFLQRQALLACEILQTFSISIYFLLICFYLPFCDYSTFLLCICSAASVSLWYFFSKTQRTQCSELILSHYTSTYTETHRENNSHSALH